MGNELLVAAAVVLVGLLTVAATVLIHYEGLRLLQRRGRGRPIRRREVLISVLGVLSLHGLQMIVYGLLMWWVAGWPGGGSIDKQGGAGLLDTMYLSALTYSTLGQAPDVTPTGAVRMLVALESLAGLLMITWSATFTYHRLSRQLERTVGDDADPDGSQQSGTDRR